jgi:AraC family transcriptional regulator, transcriptional activator FtrA
VSPATRWIATVQIVVFRYDRDMSIGSSSNRGRHRVAALVYDGLSLFELAIAAEVFGLERPELDAPWWYAFEVCAERPGPLQTLASFELVAPHGLDELAGADTVIVPGVPDVHRDPSEELVAALRAAHARGARMVSICTGAFTLAAAGLLDGKAATTHWRHTSLLARRFPRVTVTPDVLYVDNGDVLTSAGAAAGIDLCLHLVRHDHGTEIANRVARRMVVASHRDGGQAQCIERPVPPAIHDPAVTEAMTLIRGDLREALTLGRIAGHVHLSPRQFSRRFAAATGTSPGDWILRERLDASRTLLEQSDDGIEQIAGQVGLPNTSGYRRHFRAHYGVTPAAYRRSYKATRPAVGARKTLGSRARR